MSLITERRESVMRDNNTAQDTLEFLLEKMNPATKELIIGESLHGDLDLSILPAKGFRFVSHIEMTKPGEITTLSNIPKDLRVLICPDQLLSEIVGLPSKLETLRLEGNDLRTLDLGELSKLKVLNISDNRIETPGPLPASLEELYADRNGIRTLDLKHLSKLSILHLIGNDLSRLINVPPSIVDLQLEDNPMVSVDYLALPTDSVKDGMEQKVDYVESLREYFHLKREYEITLMAARKAAYAKGRTRPNGIRLAKAVKPKCIQCSRLVGTIFEQRDRRYIARCGSKEKPCDLKIQLFRGDHVNRERMMELFRESLDENKESIISQKLDTLFGYLSEEKSAEKFKQQIKDYSAYNKTFSELKTEYEDLHANPHKREMARAKLVQIHELKHAMKTMLAEYEKTGNEETLAVISNIYVNEYMPEIRNLRMLHYEVMEMNMYIPPTDLNIPGKFTTVRPNEYWLFQRDVALERDVIVSGEPPRVVAFTRR